ncbi:MAG TPA: VWA domain-containing protein [Bryobacteraceae bacterium]|jgi:VWFA-related protein
MTRGSVPLLGFLAVLSIGQEPPAIRVNTRLVEVDAVVRDKNGPVKGLTKDDFTVFDQGKPQKIATFNVTVAGHSVKTTPLPGGTVSNRLNSQGEEPVGATVVLWDKLNTETEDQSYVQKQVFNYLHTLRPGDHLALYALVKDLLVVQDFTDDPERLIRAMKRLGPEQSLNLTAGDLTDLVSQINSPILQALTQGASLADLQSMATATAAELTDYALRDRVFVTAHSLEAIAWHMAGLPGRKKLVWITGSFPAATVDTRSRVGATQIEVQDFGLQINQAIRKLNEANVAVYPIDPQGVKTGMSMGKDQGALASGAGLTNPGIETMLLFSKGTGGKSIYVDNDLTTAMKTVMDDDEVTYSLGFYPVDQKPDGSYHPLSVKVNKKGVEVRHRDGYYADDPKGTNSGNRHEAIGAVMENPLDATQIGIRATATPVKNRPGVFQIEVRLNTNELHLERVKDRWVARVQYATLFSPQESTKGTLETIQISLNEPRLRAALNDGFPLRRLVELGDHKGTLRIAVQDVGSGLSGSVHLPLPPAAP